MSDASKRDLNMEALLSKRSPLIENIYNKNLRPIQDRTQQHRNSAFGDNTLGPREDLRPAVCKEPIATELMAIREKTSLSIKNYNFEEETDDNPRDPNVVVYESACHALQIVPCSIVMKTLPTKSISLANYGFSSVGVLALTHALKTNFTVNHLDLSGNEIGAQGLKHISTLFGENNTISSLNVSRNYVGAEGVKHIISLLRKNVSLTEIDLSGNAINDDEGALLVESLDDNSLLRINLSQNKLSEITGQALGKYLSENDRLQELNLAWNHLRKKGAVAVAKGIWDNNRLVKINLAWNGFGNEGADMMGKALTHNVVLEELDMRCNRIGNPGFANLCLGMKDNTTLKRLMVGFNQLNTETCTSVLKMFATLPSLSLELFDISNITLKAVIADEIDLVRAVYPKLKCVHGFLNFGEKKVYNPSEAAIMYIQEYCEKNNISLMDLFAKLDKDGSMSVSYTEFKQGLKQSGIPITPAQIDALIKYLDKDGDGEIDFSELVIGEEKMRKSKAVKTETRDDLLNK